MDQGPQRVVDVSVLENSLERVVGFLQFAEAKNAALVTFSSAWLAGLAALRASSTTLPPDWMLAVDLGILGFTISSLIGLLSFLPRTNLRRILKAKVERPPNLLFFGDIGAMTPTDFHDSLVDKYTGDASAYRGDLTNQIYANSTIAKRKFTLFTVGAWTLVLAMLLTIHPSLFTLVKTLAKVISGS